MSLSKIITGITRYIDRLNGATILYDLERYHKKIADIRAFQKSLHTLSRTGLKARSAEVRARIKHGTSIDAVIVEAYALVAEVVRSVMGIEVFDEQLIGALVLHDGRLAEMATGEGKTLAAVFPAYLNALNGKGVHILTFNDYLAQRDAGWMAPVYDVLGTNAAFVIQGMSIEERQRAYAADITYVTAKEAGFDYLGDTLCTHSRNLVHRPFAYALIDEADSILIDEARLPLVIAGGISDDAPERENFLLARIAEVVRGLTTPMHVSYDDYSRNVYLTDAGLEAVEHALGIGNLYGEQPGAGEMIAKVSHALHAEYLLVRDKDYILRNNRVELVDECTGRIAENRRWPDGLQAAVEAKEGCPIQAGGTILNSISLQDFIGLYPKKSGMTATATAAEAEFREFYGLPVVVIPPHAPCIRSDLPDLVYAYRTDKEQAIAETIAAVHAKGQPILAGTRTISESESLAERLKQNGIYCEVLNARQDAREAEIISKAGHYGAVTIATNMAGRGTDIRLGNAEKQSAIQVRDAGGLFVIGTNRYESRRIDNQLRGRSARQGDPGMSRFYMSLEDDLFVRYRLHELIPERFLTHTGATPMEHPIIKAEMSRIQRIIEGQHFEMKKMLCSYTNLVERQRRLLLDARNEIMHTAKASIFFSTHNPEHFKTIADMLGNEAVHEMCRELYCAAHDRCWSRYLAEMNELRDGIHFRRYGAQNPLHEFHTVAIERFDMLSEEIERLALDGFSKTTVTREDVHDQTPGRKRPSATWTYTVSDDPFAEQFGLQVAANPGLSAWAGLLWPLMMLYLIFSKKPKKR